MGEELPKPQIKGHTVVSRRRFLGLVARVATLACIPQVLTSSTSSVQLGESGFSREVLCPLGQNVLVIDFAPEKQSENFSQEQFPDNERLVKRALGDKYMTNEEIVRTYDIDLSPATNSKLQLFEKIQALYKENPMLAIVLAFKPHYFDHGKDVGETMTDIWKRYRLHGKPVLHPIQELLGNFRYDDDRLHNHGFFGSVDPEKVIETLKMYPSQEIVNFSWQFGDLGYFYVQRRRSVPSSLSWETTKMQQDGNSVYFSNFSNETLIPAVENGRLVVKNQNGEIIEEAGTPEKAAEIAYKRYEKTLPLEELANPQVQVVDGYTKDTAEKNLPTLFKVCQTFPERLFIAAAGNENDDMLNAREHLKEIWPENLILVAEGNSLDQEGDDKGKFFTRIYGADVYVDNDNWKIAHGSSFSTPLVSAIASMMKDKKHMNVRQIREAILNELSDQMAYHTPPVRFSGKDGTDIPGRLLSIEKVGKMME